MSAETGGKQGLCRRCRLWTTGLPIAGRLTGGGDGTSERYPFPLPEPVDLATIDLSFISLEKPQFEVEWAQVGKGGLVNDPLLHASVLGRLISWAIEWGGEERGECEKGFRLGGLTPSPILGASGNREFFMLLKV